MKREWVTAVCCGLAIAIPTIAQAQEFQVFDHRLSKVEKRADKEVTYAPSLAVIGTEKEISSPASRSFKETLYEPLIRQAEARYRLPPRLLQALVWQESRFNPMAISPAGAAGLAQLMPATARELGVTNLHDPAQNIDGGARYLRQMLDRFGAIHLALAAYNAGPGAVSRAGGIPRNRETPEYVRSVVQRWMAYGAL
ncbi:lytic transglycosylase domain-containing protein [Qipengyuania sphaerica]|jgi:soluble lytic murein transglycosylase-like protein|uniref:lytic transglycosylase domain-containing protein n=1 Tax=Qipengyuania sphaerica TaxID=2867243 RepID=UPI001C89933B|nr:lytic transglycosylase domain-containing protein [Qipengyuania sphaerica]MBX7541918.1 lytic transglycosylase domain-containing protein [Qipengyuania sphaerica]